MSHPDDRSGDLPSRSATVEHSREDAIDGLRVIASRRGCKIQQGDVLALELAISVLMKQEARSAPRLVGMDMLRGALVFGMHKGNVSAGTDRVDISGAFDLNTVIEYLNGKLVNAPTITPSATSFTWQPIETAPKDQTILLNVPTLWGKHNKTIPLPGDWMNGFWVIYNADEAVQRVDPTHWMPLPEAPK